MDEFERAIEDNYDLLKNRLEDVQAELSRLDIEVRTGSLRTYTMKAWTEGEIARKMTLISQSLQIHATLLRAQYIQQK